MLHTSDWHIGRTFHGQDLLADQLQALDAIAQLCTEHNVDVVLVSGDIYDRAIPSADAMQALTTAMSRIRATGASVVAISGNHDSAPRLGVFTDLLEHGGFYLRTRPDSVGEPVLLSDAAGPVAIYPIPYLEPEIVRDALPIDGPGTHQTVLFAAMERIRGDLAGRPAGTRSVVLAHAFVVGGAVSGSERSIAVGGVESVAAGTFDGVDYVALGHLHGHQTITDSVRYPGSILPYSFGEATQRKGAWLVDLDEAGAVACDWLQLPVPRPLATVRGCLDEVLSGHDALIDHYLAVELTDAVRPIDPMRRLREKFPFVLTLSWEPDGGPAAAPEFPDVTPSMPDAEVVEQFLEDCRGSAPSESETALIGEIIAELRAEDVTS